MRRDKACMPPRLPKHLHDAVQAARLAVKFAGGLEVDEYAQNVLVRSAVERQLEILGEACRRALDEAPDLRDGWPEAALAVALRNRIIHGYDRLEHAIVLDTVKRDPPLLVTKLETELKRFPLE